MNTSVAHARAQLAEAETAQAKERHAQLVAQLALTRKTLRTEQRELEKLKRKIFKGQADLDNCRAEINSYSDALAMIQAQKPAVADHLPSDPDVVEWRNKCERLEDALEILRARRVALPNVELLRIEGVNLAKHVQELLFAETSILGQLDGSIAQSRVGGVFAPS